MALASSRPLIRQPAKRSGYRRRLKVRGSVAQRRAELHIGATATMNKSSPFGPHIFTRFIQRRENWFRALGAADELTCERNSDRSRSLSTLHLRRLSFETSSLLVLRSQTIRTSRKERQGTSGALMPKRENSGGRSA